MRPPGSRMSRSTRRSLRRADRRAPRAVVPAGTVKIGPSAEDLVGRLGTTSTSPARRSTPGASTSAGPAASPRNRSGRLFARSDRRGTHPGSSLQYWLFYAFNDFNNLHEGDWEMIQPRLDARDAREALDEEPESIGFSSHEGAERADWGDEKLELADGVRPIVYPAAGSHANKFTEALYIGSSAEAGVGCDDTRGPHVELRPHVETIPSDPEAAREEFPWIAFEGRWGERQKAFFNGPTGPNLKTQWNEPIEWSEGWRERSYAVPTSGVLGTGATDFFCSAVETGSSALVPAPQPAADASRPGRAWRSSFFSLPGRCGVLSRRSGSVAGEPGARSSPRPAGCTSGARGCSSASASCSSRSAP